MLYTRLLPKVRRRLNQTESGSNFPNKNRFLQKETAMVSLLTKPQAVRDVKRLWRRLLIDIDVIQVAQ